MQDYELRSLALHTGEVVPYIISDYDLPGPQEVWQNTSSEADIETTGFSAKKDKITLLIAKAHFLSARLPDVPDGTIFLVRKPESDCLNFKTLMASPQRTLFHNGKFDLGFLMEQWYMGSNDFNGFRDTTVASKALHPKRNPPGRNLHDLVLEHTGIDLPKGQATSNWLKAELDEDQIRYALEDVHYLAPLWAAMGPKLTQNQKSRVIKTCEYLPAYLEWGREDVKNPFYT